MVRDLRPAAQLASKRAEVEHAAVCEGEASEHLRHRLDRRLGLQGRVDRGVVSLRIVRLSRRSEEALGLDLIDEDRDG